VHDLNRVYETSYASFDLARMPIDQVELKYVEDRAGSLRWDFVTRNYAAVFRELISQGRPFWNTLIVCGFTVALTLLINPMAAYAMSRFQLPGTYKILLLLMVTAAFPPMVVLVPNF
jgi:multiple sugar transport system permease protein